MLLKLYKYHLSYIYFMKGLYCKRNSDNTTNAIVLGFFLIIFNIHSIFVLLECLTNFKIGLLEFWTPGKTPKVGLGYIIGFLFSIVYFVIASFVKKSTPEKERRIIMKRIVSKGSNKISSVLFTLFSILLFLGTIVLLILTVIPNGGIK